jgi:AAA15 family ATPase/GTPase
MLQDLHIRGFKGFRDFLLTELSGVTLVGGKNNVGKTSLLEAIFLFYDITEPRTLFDHLRWRGLSRPYIDIESLVSPIFADFNMNNSISLELRDGIYTSKMNISFNPSEVQKTADIDVSNDEDTTASLKTEARTTTLYHINVHYEVSGVGQEDVAIVLHQTPTNVKVTLDPHSLTITPPGIQHKVVFFPLRSQINFSEEMNRFSTLSITRELDRLVDFLRVIEPRLIGLTVAIRRATPLIYADVQGLDRKVPVAFLGDGMSKLLSIILAIATAKNGIVLIDEFDAGVHHSVLPKVWEGIFKAAKDFNCQIIATTHSYECLQSAYDGASKAQAEGDFSYIRLDSYENNVVAKHYSHAVLGAALEQGWEVR